MFIDAAEPPSYRLEVLGGQRFCQYYLRYCLNRIVCGWYRLTWKWGGIRVITANESHRKILYQLLNKIGTISSPISYARASTREIVISSKYMTFRNSVSRSKLRVFPSFSCGQLNVDLSRVVWSCVILA